MQDWFVSQIRESVRIKEAILSDAALVGQLVEASRLCADAYRRGGKLLIAGNGGSASDAQHIAGELVSRFYYDRPALAAVALTTDTSIITAIGNDYGYDRIFARQIEANGTPGDVFLAISTSGNSPNILAGIAAARAKDLRVVGLTGASGGKMRDLCDLCLCMPSDSTPRIQEAHILMGHILCAYIERDAFPK